MAILISRRSTAHVRHAIRWGCAKATLLGLILVCCALAFLKHGPASVFISSFLSGERPCDCLRNLQLEVRANNRVWLPRDGDEQCKQRCATILCENCDAPMDGIKRQDCAMACDVHGTCPRVLPLTADQVYECPRYEDFPKEDYLAVLRSLGATIRPYTDHPGIEVRGLVLSEPPLLHNQGFWCAVQHLIYDYKLVMFKEQENGTCMTDYEYCKAVIDRTALDGDVASLKAKMWMISNHPMLGQNAANGHTSACPPPPHQISEGRDTRGPLNQSKWQIAHLLPALFFLAGLSFPPLPFCPATFVVGTLGGALAPGPCAEWHYDGRAELCSASVFTVLASPGADAGTQFVATAGVVKEMSATEADFWSRMWWQSPFKESAPRDLPVLFTHPVTNERVVYVFSNAQLGRGHPGRAPGSLLPHQESRALMDELSGLLSASRHAFNLTWVAGDVAFVDNIALMHRSLPGGYSHFELGGLRLIRHGICGCRLNSSLRATKPIVDV
eukprot:jgi/Mesvir1/27807/Mv07488-RA.1